MKYEFNYAFTSVCHIHDQIIMCDFKGVVHQRFACVLLKSDTLALALEVCLFLTVISAILTQFQVVLTSSLILG